TKIKAASILALIHLISADVSVMGFSATSAWWTHFTYPFFHASWVHLIVNLYAFWKLYDGKPFGKRTLIYAYTLSVAASFVLPSIIPTVGLSGAIYAFIAFRYANDTNMLSTLIVSIALLSGYLIPGINGNIHLVSFMSALVMAKTNSLITRYTNDNRGITARKR
ncbi:MAG: rhomboid family intramembrane serine protease, partial [Tannerellaceae bacterium]